MLKNGYTITSKIDPDTISKIKQYESSLNLREKIMEGVKYCRLFGGAGGLIVIEGDEDLSQPLDYDFIMPDSFKGLLIFNCKNEIVPTNEIINDIYSLDFGLPKFYNIINCQQENIRVHHSRICRFIDNKILPLELANNNYWGQSEIYNVIDEILKYDNVSKNIINIIQKSNISVLNLFGIGQKFNCSKTKNDFLQNKLNLINNILNNEKILAIGEHDKFQNIKTSFKGLVECYDRFMLDISGASGIPISKLFGRTPDCIESTNEIDLNNYYDMIHKKQEHILRPVYEKILPLIFLSTCGYIPDDLDFEFNSLKKIDEIEKTKLNAIYTNNIINVYNSGLISKEIALKELKSLSKLTGSWKNINEKEIENIEKFSIRDVGEIDPNPPYGKHGINGQYVKKTKSEKQEIIEKKQKNRKRKSKRKNNKKEILKRKNKQNRKKKTSYLKKYKIKSEKGKIPFYTQPAYKRRESMERSIDRRKKYQNNWQNASLKEMIEKFVPNAIKNSTNIKGKDIYTNGSNIQIVHDLIGKYFRIQDITINSPTHCYLTLEGQLELNKTIIKKNGKSVQNGKSSDEYNIDTHFGNLDQMTKQRPIKRYKSNFYVKRQVIKEQKNDQVQDSFMQDNKNIVSKHRWEIIVPLNKRGVILWNHLKENEKYIKYFKFNDVNDEYEKIFDIVYETGNRDIMISSYESDVVELKYFAELREAIKRLNYTEKDIPNLLEAMKLAEESNTFLQWSM